MKNKLICQSSDFDCGPTSVTNAIRFLFERNEITPTILRQIWAMGNDAFSADGEPGKAGTSKASMRYMAAWFECFAEKCRFPIKSAFVDGEEAAIEKGSQTWECLERGGCAVMRCTHGGDGHYVLLTGILPDGTIGLFDPYDETPDRGDPERRFIYDEPKKMNRAVSVAALNRQDFSDYAMGPLEKRENLLLWRGDS